MLTRPRVMGEKRADVLAVETVNPVVLYDRHPSFFRNADRSYGREEGDVSIEAGVDGKENYVAAEMGSIA